VEGERSLVGTVICLALAGLFLSRSVGLEAEASFTNLLAQAALAESRGDILAAVEIYGRAQKSETDGASHLCVLARRYCGLTYLTDSAAIQKDLVKQALACSLEAVTLDGNSADAHACLAVAYAKSCAFADLKTELAYSRLFKLEAEKTIALDPKQDIAYYLLGRWNYAIANAGFFARAYVKLIYGGLPKASYQDAIADFHKAIALAPNRIIHHAGLAMACEAAGEKTLALAELSRCQGMKAAGPEDEEARRDALKQLSRLSQE
jgi:tetratricopeptide (TPR) repeat protein